MKFSCNWLKDLLGGLPPLAELSDLLTFAGIEVEGTEKRGADIEKVVVARIASSEKHPGADRLSVCMVEDGSGEPRQIVCGAKNYKPGDKAPLALPGAVLPGGVKIKSGKLRGVKSDGMLCSAAELGLAADAEGLLILDPAAPVGAPIGQIFPGDTVLELEITPNRPDLLSHHGLARDLATLLKREPVFPRVSQPVGSPAVAPVEVVIEAPEACLFYSGRRISGVRIGPSPRWLAEKLESCGLRPINNVVDVTNYVLLETGQPLHAFDAAKLSGAIRPRFARPGERFAALDGSEHVLGPGHLVIADDAGPQALAGVMGGAGSGVSEGTKEIILEAAWFEPAVIRRAARETGLSSDSSYRFERGVDPGAVAAAEARAAALIVELAGGEAGPATVAKAPGFEERSRPREVVYRHGRCLDLLGYEVSAEEARRSLEGLGLELVGEESSNRGPVMRWRVPTFRRDLEREADLIEEVCRLAGMSRIPGRMAGLYAGGGEADALHDFRLRVSRGLAAAGFHEARTLALVSEAALADCPPGTGPALALRNPMSADHTHLRPSLVPGLLAVLEHNLRHGAAGARLFEIGPVFDGAGAESERLALLVCGRRAGGLRQPPPSDSEFFDLKGALEGLGLERLSFARKVSDLPLDLEIRAGDRLLGRAAALPSARVKALGTRDAVFVAELEMSALRAALSGEKRYRPLLKFPAAVRDVAFVADSGLRHEQVIALLTGAGEERLESVAIFDVFTDPKGERIPAGKKSMAYSLTYRAADRTLTDEEVAAAHAALVARLEKDLGVQARV